MASSIRRLLGATALVALMASPCFAQAPAQSQGGASSIGTLSCDTSGGIGLIIASQQRLNCTYQGIDNRIEGYFGTISKIGLDVGQTTQGVLVWQVFAPTLEFAPFALEGNYVGPSGQATAGAGLSANLLIGGFNQTFSLQPLSVGAQGGLNLAVGVANLTLVGRRGR